MADQLFEWDVPDKPKRTKQVAVPVDRRDGWSLVTNSHLTPTWWHLVDHTDLVNATSWTACGLAGRIVPEECAKITLCPDCQDAERATR